MIYILDILILERNIWFYLNEIVILVWISLVIMFFVCILIVIKVVRMFLCNLGRLFRIIVVRVFNFYKLKENFWKVNC